MGQFDRMRPQDQSDGQPTTGRAGHPRSAADHLAFDRPAQLLLSIGIDGRGPMTSAADLAHAARARSATTEEAVARVTLDAVVTTANGGLLTGVEGFAPTAVTLPLNVAEFYVQAARMVSAIATLRGHDVDDYEVRRAVLQTLVRTQTDSVLVKAISSSRGGALTERVLNVLPAGALLAVNKGIGYHLLRAMSERMLRRFGLVAPLVSGVLVAATDGWMMRRIAEQARVDFPLKGPAVRVADQGPAAPMTPQ